MAESMETARSEAEVERVLGFAKLDRKDFIPTVQCISFEGQLDNEAVQLMEVDKDILDELMEGERLVIRGGKEDSAVLCTKHKTYEIRTAEMSNTMLLLPALKMPDDLKSCQETILHTEVHAMKYAYYEVKPIRARVKRVQTLLEENVYSGWECEEDEDHQGKKYTYKDLQTLVQASDQELNNALQELGACEIKGVWRLLEFDFENRVFEEILRLIDEQSWSLEAIPMSECCDVLQDLYPRSVVAHVLQSYADPLSEDSNEYRLNEDKVCSFYAKVILKPYGKFHLEDFERTWSQSVPEGLTTGLYQLEGMVLVDRDSKPPVIRYFPESQLPEGLEERFNILFRTKEKWSLEEITPYIRRLATPKQAVGAMLMKFARASTQNGVRVYNSKKPLL